MRLPAQDKNRPHSHRPPSIGSMGKRSQTTSRAIPPWDWAGIRPESDGDIQAPPHLIPGRAPGKRGVAHSTMCLYAAALAPLPRPVTATVSGAVADSDGSPLAATSPSRKKPGPTDPPGRRAVA